MASHLSTIGLSAASEQDFWDLAQQVGPLADALPVPGGGTYFRWADPSAAELWLQVNEGHEVIGMNPHFAGESAVRVGLTARIPPDGPSPFDGSFHGWADPQSPDGPESGCYPFVFDAPDYRLHDDLALPLVTEVQVAAFAHEIEAFESVESYNASQTGEVKFASQSFIPSGLFSPGGETPGRPTAHAIFTGHVIEAERRVNALTGRPFHWALVDTLGGVFDVVIDPVLLPEVPQVGGVVSGLFWLTGRILTT